MIIYGKRKHDRGFINTLEWPTQIHISEYSRPAAKRITRKDLSISSSNIARNKHDVDYSDDDDVTDQFIPRMLDKNCGEKSIAKTMKIKSKFGMGVSPLKNKSFKDIIEVISKSMIVGHSADNVIRSALESAHQAVKEAGCKQNIKIPHFIPIPAKIGGYLSYLIPIFAGLSATGSLEDGTTGIAQAVYHVKSAIQQLQKKRSHDKTMENIVLGKGLCLKSHKTALGLYLKPYRYKDME